jgi:hypothetical protein
MDDDFIPILIGTFIGGFVLYAITRAVVLSPGATMRRKFQKLGSLNPDISQAVTTFG